MESEHTCRMHSINRLDSYKNSHGYRCRSMAMEIPSPLSYSLKLFHSSRFSNHVLLCRISLKPLSRAKPNDYIEPTSLRYAAVVFAYDPFKEPLVSTIINCHLLLFLLHVDRAIRVSQGQGHLDKVFADWSQRKSFQEPLSSK